MFAYRPEKVLGSVRAPIVAVRRITPGDDAASRAAPPPSGIDLVELEAPGHNLLRYRPDEATAAVLGR
jgi:hypothetical protein